MRCCNQSPCTYGRQIALYIPPRTVRDQIVIAQGVTEFTKACFQTGNIQAIV